MLNTKGLTLRRKFNNELEELVSKYEKLDLGFFGILQDENGVITVTGNICPICSIENLNEWAIENNIKHFNEEDNTNTKVM